jgi:predicted Zn-dependent protease
MNFSLKRPPPGAKSARIRQIDALVNEREKMLARMVSEFPDSAMAQFSLGKFLLEERRYPEAGSTLEKAVSLDPDYAAAWVALGDVRAQLTDAAGAKEAWGRALKTPLGQRDGSLQSDLEMRIAEL